MSSSSRFFPKILVSIVLRYAGQKNKSKKVKSCLNPEFEFTTGYVTEEGGPTELVIGKTVQQFEIIPNYRAVGS